MHRTFNITRNAFSIWRYSCTFFVTLTVTFFCYVLLPLSVPYIYYIGLHTSPKDITTGITLALLSLICCVIFLPFYAMFEKRRLPISISLDDHLLRISDRTGKEWKVRYSMCRHTRSFELCYISSPLFIGTWARGVTIYIPRASIEGFCEGIHDMAGNAPVSTAFHIPIIAKDMPEIISFLEKHRCKQVAPPKAIHVLIALSAPTLFLSGHFVMALLLSEQLGTYGIIGSICVGLLSGTFFGSSAIKKPYMKIDYIRRKHLDKQSVYGMIALSVGFPLFLWSDLNGISELRPDFFGAFFIFLLCYLESYLWLHCITKRETM